MKKRNLVLCLASLCGATALICGTLLSNGNVFSLSSTVANYDLKIDNQNIEINGTHASIKAADATYNLNLDVNGTLTKKEGYLRLQGSLSNFGNASSKIKGMSSISLTSEGAIYLEYGKTPSLVKKVSLKSDTPVELDNSTYFRISSERGTIYSMNITYTCNDQSQDVIVSGDALTLPGIALSTDTVNTIGWKRFYFTASEGKLTINDYVPAEVNGIGLTSDSGDYFLNYKKAIASKNNVITHFSSDSDTYELSLPSAVGVTRVNLNQVETSFALNGNKVSLEHANASMDRVDVFTEDDNVYRFYINKLASDKRDASFLKANLDPGTEVITISSVEQFKTLFQGTDGVLSEEQKANLSKIYLLDADLDFNNESIYTIGHSGAEPLPFYGRIYGNGYTIKNFSINSIAGQSKTALIGDLAGHIYDLNIENMTNESNSWAVGGLSATSTGTIENVHVINSTIRKGDTRPELNSSENLGAIAGKMFAGSISSCSYNGYLGGLYIK
ncbi:MAG: hypothetical protein MR659_05000 [Mollicutes bacterium]|nr:hypothetical protein [Mollicutes bacterium]MDD7715708.1 hypothetical protein [Mollicutes bacterium]MDY3904804.1 hypothetical protein [Candidatus Enteromonas sp.]